MSMENSPSKKCLLIIPRHFYSFEDQFTRNLEERGYRVTVANDEYPANNFGKILGKLNIPIIRPLTERKIARDFLDGKLFDVILIFKGRGINAALIKKMAQASRRIIGYNWDSFKYNKAPLRWYKHSTRYYTFDYRDSINYNIPVVELFSSTKELGEGVPKDIALSAIFRNHSGRLKYLDRVLKILKEPDPYIFIFEQNIFFFVINFLKNPRLYLKYRAYISFDALSHKQYIDVLQRSRVTVDYAHPQQSGLTMRSFEALSTNTGIITNNANIFRSKYLDAGNAVVFKEDAEPRALLEGLRNVNNSYGRDSKASRSLDDFMDDLLK